MAFIQQIDLWIILCLLSVICRITNSQGQNDCLKVKKYIVVTHPLVTSNYKIFSCAATQEVPVSVRLSACLPIPDFKFRHKIDFTKPLPQKIYCWLCCRLLCLPSSLCRGLESPINF